MANLADGAARPTLVEVARLAGVSTATVSRVASGSGPVGDETRTRVEDAIAETGWVPNRVARLLASGKGDEVAIVIVVGQVRELVEDPYYVRVIAGASEAADHHGLVVSVHTARPGRVAALVPFEGDPRYVGAVLVNVGAEEAGALPASSLRLASLGASAPGIASFDPENRIGATRALEHLLIQGRRRIAMIAGPRVNPCANERSIAYRLVMRAAGLPVLEASSDFTRRGGAEAARWLIEQHPDVDALFVASDLMAIAALDVLRLGGRSVPADVAVVGFDDSPLSEIATPCLTTVAQPVEQLAGLAVRSLLDRNVSRPHGQRLPTRLVLRRSA